MIYPADFLPTTKEDHKNIVTFYTKLLASAHYYLDGNLIYKKQYKSHPHFEWLILSHIHYNYLLNLYNNLAAQYKMIYNTEHRQWKKYHLLLIHPPQNIPITIKYKNIPLMY